VIFSLNPQLKSLIKSSHYLHVGAQPRRVQTALSTRLSSSPAWARTNPTTDCNNQPINQDIFTQVKKGSPYSITEHRVPELIPVLGSQPAGDVSHKPGGKLPLLSAGPAVTLETLKRAATNFAAW